MINDLKNLEHLFGFSNFNENHELFCKKNRKVVGKYKKETPENTWIDEFVCLRSKAYSFKCGNKNTNKLKGISKSYSKNIKFVEQKNCLNGKEYQKEGDNYRIRSFNHEMYLQLVPKSILSLFDDKRY